MTTATINSGRPSLAPTDGARTWARKLVHFAHYFGACLEVARQRRQLFTLDERALKDMGISRADAHREAKRDFWDIPEDQKPRR